MTTPAFAHLPDPPYYAVVFSSLRTPVEEGYADVAERMVTLAQRQPGFLGVESTRGADGFGITVSYWTSLAAIADWRANAEHRVAQATGKSQWYDHYELRIALVEKAYGKKP